MSKNDAAKVVADRVGGWENLARGLYELCTSGKKTILVKYYMAAEQLRISKVFFPVRKGRPAKRDWLWFWMVEGILEKGKAQNQHNQEDFIIDKNLDVIYGSVLTGRKKRDTANKTVRNALAEHRRKIRKIQAQYDPAQNPAQTFLDGYEDPPVGCEYTDDPRLHD